MKRRTVLQAMTAAGASSLFRAEAQTVAQPTRIPLHEFVADGALLEALRTGVKGMKKRPPSDPLSWFYQAAMHGVTDAAVTKATAEDANVANVDKAKYWGQCPHGGQFHSADFLPWHRAYTHYFERILRYHTGLADFALPYWDYSDKSRRQFPRAFGIEHLNGDLNDETPDNINPLYHPERDNYLAVFEHPFAHNLPYLELSDSAVDASAAMATPVFFGEVESDGLAGGIADNDGTTRGLLETSPHDPIHRLVGGIIPSAFDPDGNPIGMALGAMATPPTAGFDPIFCVHHSNIDRLWAEWSVMSGKSWGKLPDKDWFDAAPWFFFDIDTSTGTARPVEVNLPRKSYFDYRALGVRFKYENLAATPLPLPSSFPPPPPPPPAPPTPLVLAMTGKKLMLDGVLASTQALPMAANPQLAPRLRAARAARAPQAPGRKGRILVRLKNVELGFVRATGFDVHLVTAPKEKLSRQEPSFIGSLTLFNHDHHDAHGQAGGHNHGAAAAAGGHDQTFDATKAVAALGNVDMAALHVVLVPYQLAVARDGGTFIDPTPAKFEGVEILEVP